MAQKLSQQPRVAIIGAGYAGMAAAAELTAGGIPVTVFESSRTLGGRARTVEIHDTILDNGQHILIGAYRETLRLMRLVGADPERLLLRLPLTLAYPGEMRIAAPRLPAPLHLAFALLGAQGLRWREKFAAMRFMQALKRTGFRLAADCRASTVSVLLDVYRQPQRLRKYLWEPLCVAALNTPAEIASAQVFANVLRDSLAAEARASDLLLPRVDVGALFPTVAASYISKHGGGILLNTAIQRISNQGKAFILHSGNEGLSHGPYSHVIAAVAPYHLTALIEGLPQLGALQEAIANIAYEPIVTCYLRYPPQVRLPFPMLGNANGIMQWLFDRGQLDGPPGLLAAVISARGQHQELSQHALAERLHAEIAAIMTRLHTPLPTPLWSQVIAEKRATFSCTPDLARPETKTPLAGLLLAGDYVASDYPGTLESAVRSGIKAAASAAASILGQTPADQA